MADHEEITRLRDALHSLRTSLTEYAYGTNKVTTALEGRLKALEDRVDHGPTAAELATITAEVKSINKQVCYLRDGRKAVLPNVLNIASVLIALAAFVVSWTRGGL